MGNTTRKTFVPDFEAITRLRRLLKEDTLRGVARTLDVNPGSISQVLNKDTRRALVIAAAVLLPALALGVVLYGAMTLQAAPTALLAVPSPVVVERVIQATPVLIERVVQVQASPVVIVVTATPAEQGPGARGQAQAPSPKPQAPVSTPIPPTPVSRPAPAPQPVAQAYGCVGLGPCNPPNAAPPKVFAGYQCADGRFFPANGPWGMFGFGTWIAEPQGGDVYDIRDTTEPGPAMGWHNNCSRVWR